MNKIGILTSGGDSPGMNAVIRAIVRTASKNKIKVIGIKYGYTGLLSEDFIDMDPFSVSQIGNLGGTILRTSRCPEFETEAGIEKAVNICSKHKLNAIIAIGGDGTLRGAQKLALNGVACLCIPSSVDNDIPCSEYTVGFDTAINTVREIVDKIISTVISHDRCFIIEVMGRNCGDIALTTAIACGATAVLIPEKPFRIEDVISQVKDSREKGKKNQLIIVSEGVTNTKNEDAFSVFELAKAIESATKINTRADVIGFVQRGGTPTTYERVIGNMMGCYAVKLCIQNKKNRVIVLRNGKMGSIDFKTAFTMTKPSNIELYNVIRSTAL